MNHTTQEPKSMQLAVELEYRKEYEAAHELRAQQARIAYLEAQLYAIGAGGVGASIQPPVQADTEAPLRCDVCGVECANPWHFSTETKRHKHACDACWGRMKIPGQVGELDHTTAPQQEPVAGARCKIIYNCKSCQHSAGRQSYMLAAQQRPVAWKWRYKDGELSSVTFDTRKQCKSNSDGVAGEAVPLYTAPQPTENLNCKSNQKRLATLWGYVKQEPARKPLTDEQIIEIADKTQTAEPGTDGYILPISFARAIEQAHGITGDQQ